MHSGQCVSMLKYIKGDVMEIPSNNYLQQELSRQLHVQSQLQKQIQYNAPKFLILTVNMCISYHISIISHHLFNRSVTIHHKLKPNRNKFTSISIRNGFFSLTCIYYSSNSKSFSVSVTIRLLEQFNSAPIRYVPLLDLERSTRSLI